MTRAEFDTKLASFLPVSLPAFLICAPLFFFGFFYLIHEPNALKATAVFLFLWLGPAAISHLLILQRNKTVRLNCEQCGHFLYRYKGAYRIRNSGRCPHCRAELFTGESAPEIK